jgi:dipeptidyl aminopeptidase/acylaminoacyl peptidase
MLDCKIKIITIQTLNLLVLLFVETNLMTACLNYDSTSDGITYIASRGSAPPAQSIVWSPTDDDKLLITAYETPAEPSKVYVLEIRTKRENILVDEAPASIIEAKWTPDGTYALILLGGDITGFDVPGWWKVNLANKTSEHILNLMDAAWSPDGKTVVALQEEKEGVKTIAIRLVLISGNAKEEQIIATYDQADSTSGLSWSPDGQHLVFSLGDYGFHALYILNIRTRQVEKLTENIGSGFPVWSPAGNVIAFERYPSIHLIDVDRKCEVEVPNLENVWSPTWSPDGRKLAYIDRDGIYYLEIDKVFERDIYQDLCK